MDRISLLDLLVTLESIGPMRVVKVLVGLLERQPLEGLWSVRVLVEVMGRSATFT